MKKVAAVLGSIGLLASVGCQTCFPLPGLEWLCNPCFESVNQLWDLVDRTIALAADLGLAIPAL